MAAVAAERSRAVTSSSGWRVQAIGDRLLLVEPDVTRPGETGLVRVAGRADTAGNTIRLTASSRKL